MVIAKANDAPQPRPRLPQTDRVGRTGGKEKATPLTRNAFSDLVTGT
jgi:hypothetical protein